MAGLSDETRRLLELTSTATLTTQLFKRGLRNTFVQGVRRLTPGAPVMVGEAFTLRMIPAREDLDHPGMFVDRSHPQRRAIEECPAGAVLAIDCRKDLRGGSLGDILCARLLERGVAGVVTDGAMRDVPPDRSAGDPGLCRRGGGAGELRHPSRGRPEPADRVRRRRDLPGRCAGRRSRGRGGDPASSGRRGRAGWRRAGAARSPGS